MTTKKNYAHTLHLPRYVPKGELQRLDWGDQLVDGYAEKYKGALPLFPEDPEATAEYIAARQEELLQAHEMHLVVANNAELYHGNVDLRNHFYYGKDGDPEVIVTHPISPQESGASKLKPGLFARLLWMAHTISANPQCDDNIRKDLGIFDPGPPHPDPHTQVFHIDGDRHIDGQAAVDWTRHGNDGAVFEYQESDGTDWHLQRPPQLSGHPRSRTTARRPHPRPLPQERPPSRRMERPLPTHPPRRQPVKLAITTIGN